MDSHPIPAGYTPHLQTPEGFRYRVLHWTDGTLSAWYIWDAVEGDWRGGGTDDAPDLVFFSSVNATREAAKLNAAWDAAKGGDLFSGGAA